MVDSYNDLGNTTHNEFIVRLEELIQDELPGATRQLLDCMIGQGYHAADEDAFLQQQHDDPIDCRRFTIYGLESELARRGFVTINKGMHIGPTVTMLTLGAYYVSLWIGGRGLVSRTASAGVFPGPSFTMSNTATM